MIEERILEWIDLGDSVQIIDIFQKKKPSLRRRRLCLLYRIVRNTTDNRFKPKSAAPGKRVCGLRFILLFVSRSSALGL